MNATSTTTGRSLSDLDWKVVDVGLLDGPVSIDPDSFLSRLARSLFGLPVAPRLANERLEALRRFSIRAWYCDLIRARDVRPLVAAGYSIADIFSILAHVGRYRGFTPAMEELAI